MTSNPVTPDRSQAAQSPNEQLGAEIADALVEAGLITDRHKAGLLAKLKSGGVRQEDWNLWVDMATATGEEADDE